MTITEKTQTNFEVVGHLRWKCKACGVVLTGYWQSAKQHINSKKCKEGKGAGKLLNKW